MRSFLITLMIVSIVAIFVVGGYYLRNIQESTPAPLQETGGLPPAQTLPSGGAQGGTAEQTPPVKATIAASKLAQVSQNQALDYFVDKGSNVFIIQPDGSVIKATGGKVEVLSAAPVTNITGASFSFDGKRALALVDGGADGSKMEIFDTEQKSWRLLKDTAQSAVWSPDSHKLAVLPPADKSYSLYVMDADNTSAKPNELMKIRQEDASLDWVTPSNLFLSDAPSSNWKSSVWSIDPTKKTISPVLTDKPGLEAVWNPSQPAAGLAMFSGTAGLGMELWLVDRYGNQIQQMGFLTFPSKCAFYDKPVEQTSTASSAGTSTAAKASAPKTVPSLVCGVPRDGLFLERSSLPDDYLQKAIYTSDDFFETDVLTGQTKSFFSDTSKNFDATDVKVFNQSVYFINRYDRMVYSVTLPQ